MRITRRYVLTLRLLLFTFVMMLSARSVWPYSPIMVDTSIHFEPGSAVIRDKSRPILDDNVDLMKRNPTLQVIFEGHTDALESPKRAQQLSLTRANAVRDYFVSQGISPSRLYVRGYADFRSVADNNMEEGRARNRRVNSALYSPPKRFEGIRQVPVSELEKKLKDDLREKIKNAKDDLSKPNSYDLLLVALLHQVAYAWQALSLPVETWDGEDYYAWATVDPGQTFLHSHGARLAPKTSEHHFKNAQHYFSEVLALRHEIVIGGLDDYGRERRRKAYRGLFWCLMQMNQEKRSASLYGKYRQALQSLGDAPTNSTENTIKEMSSAEFLNRFSPVNSRLQAFPLEAKADYLFLIYLSSAHRVLVELDQDSLALVSLILEKNHFEKSTDPQFNQQLEEAIQLYHLALNKPRTPLAPDTMPRDRFQVKAKLTVAEAQKLSKQQALDVYERLLNEALEVDRGLSEIPGEDSDTSIELWRKVYPLLDPVQDAVFIKTNELKLKNAGLKANVDPPYGVNLFP